MLKDVGVLASEDSKGKFRLQNQKYLLTYKTHLDKGKYKSWLSMKWNKAIREIHIAHESGDGYPHTHVLVDFGACLNTRRVDYFDYESVHPHIKKVLTLLHWNNGLSYLAKEDPECKYLLDDPKVASLLSKVIACESEELAVSMFVKSPSDYMGIRAMYRDRKQLEYRNKVLISEESMHDWQRVFLRVLSQGASGRTVNWVYDRRGGSGKTEWSKHMTDNYGTGWCVISCIGREADLYQNIRNAQSGGWSGQGIIFDLPRACEDKTHLYTCLESVINGRLTATKYEGGLIDIGGSPSVWVFANFLPNTGKMSMDRWRVLMVGKKGRGVALVAYSPGGGMYNTPIGDGVVGYSYIRGSSSESSGTLDDDMYKVPRVAIGPVIVQDAPCSLSASSEDSAPTARDPVIVPVPEPTPVVRASSILSRTNNPPSARGRPSTPVVRAPPILSRTNIPPSARGRPSTPVVRASSILSRTNIPPSARGRARPPPSTRGRGLPR